MSARISETVSEKRKRGRPRRYHPDRVAWVVKSLGSLTPRAAQNKIHLSRAAAVLEPAARQYPELRWLLDRDQGTFRGTTIAEVGRVPHDKAMIFLAREVRVRELTAAQPSHISAGSVGRSRIDQCRNNTVGDVPVM
jgi:hypothetical protein